MRLAGTARRMAGEVVAMISCPSVSMLAKARHAHVNPQGAASSSGMSIRTTAYRGRDARMAAANRTTARHRPRDPPARPRTGAGEHAARALARLDDAKPLQPIGELREPREKLSTSVGSPSAMPRSVNVSIARAALARRAARASRYPAVFPRERVSLAPGGRRSGHRSPTLAVG